MINENAYCSLSQNRRTLLASLTLFIVLEVLPSNSSLVTGVTFGSISVSLQISIKIFGVRFLKSLCIIDTNLPFSQLIQCVILNLLPQAHVFC